MKYFQVKRFVILHLNVDSPLPKIDEIHFFAKQLNVGISETQLH